MIKSRWLLPSIIFFLFLALALFLFSWTANPFYLFNFLYIGSLVSAGIYLMGAEFQHGRLLVQLGVGSYMLLYLGILRSENMQIEGFWYYIFLGVFQGAVIHYVIAKISGPILFGRGWCGYACWTSMILDLLPYRRSGGTRRRLLDYVKYMLFLIAPVTVFLILTRADNPDTVMFWAFIAGNMAYYVTGIALAVALGDNRAFCKYICPVSIFLKASSYLSLLRVRFDENKCKNCMKCLSECPMDVDMRSNSRRRTNGTDCILCMRCISICQEKALHL